MAQLSVLFSFYKRYAAFTLFITVLCCCFLWVSNGDVILQAFTKMLTDLLVLYFFLYDKDKFYYYLNLHISKRKLLISYFITDLFIFSICIWLTGALM